MEIHVCDRCGRDDALKEENVVPIKCSSPTWANIYFPTVDLCTSCREKLRAFLRRDEQKKVQTSRKPWLAALFCQ